MDAGPGPLKILVVDDDPLVREMLGEILGALGHRVVSAGGGPEALAAIDAEEGIDLIVSDMDMPGMSGLELIKRLRRAHCEIPAVILTGNQEIRVAVEAMKSGAQDYLIKDENIADTLFLAIGNAMEKHRLRQENQRLLEDLACKNRELERLSLLDGLTGVPNRRYFDKLIQQEWSRAVREGLPIAVVMIDIDYFKRYNDTYGHPQGDACLREVAAALAAALKRSSDFIARYGGEEFVAVLPDTELEGARLLAEAMRENVLALALEHGGSGVCRQVTVSLGAASAAPGCPSTPAALIRAADEALYAAKEGGRNRTGTATPA